VLSAYQPVVFGMGTNPDPDHTAGLQQTQGTVVVANSHGHQIVPAFKPAISQRWVIGVRLPEPVIFDGKALHFYGQVF
jgi:hypothetical protein